MTKSHVIESMPRVLVIAIGNPLRSDDGLAWHAADELREQNSSPDVKILKVHQLTPELAEDLSHVERVIFVDAAATSEPGTVRCERMSPSPAESGSSHGLTPGALLQLATMLYEVQPAAFLVSMAGKNFGHGEALSPAVQQSLLQLVQKVHQLAVENIE